jgi:hypothetical protein
MAAPPASLGAHESQRLAGSCPRFEGRQGSPERVRAHVRRVGNEAMRAPRALRVGRHGYWSPTTQRFAPPLVAEAERRQVGLELLPGEAWLPAASRVAADVDDGPCAGSPQQPGEAIGRADSMADGPDDGLARRASAKCPRSSRASRCLRNVPHVRLDRFDHLGGLTGKHKPRHRQRHPSDLGDSGPRRH